MQETAAPEEGRSNFAELRYPPAPLLESDSQGHNRDSALGLRHYLRKFSDQVLLTSSIAERTQFRMQVLSTHIGQEL